MKKSILLSAIILAGTGIIGYLLFRKKSFSSSSDGVARQPRTHHRTGVFSRAKQTIAAHHHE